MRLKSVKSEQVAESRVRRWIRGCQRSSIRSTRLRQAAVVHAGVGRTQRAALGKVVHVTEGPLPGLRDGRTRASAVPCAIGALRRNPSGLSLRSGLRPVTLVAILSRWSAFSQVLPREVLGLPVEVAQDSAEKHRVNANPPTFQPKRTHTTHGV